MSDRPEDVELHDLVEELHDVKRKWYSIGIQLKVPYNILDEIEATCKDDLERALRKMLQRWLAQINPKPSWTGVVKALNTRSVGESTLANNIADRRNLAVPLSTSMQTANSATLQHNAAAALNANGARMAGLAIDPDVEREMERLYQLFESLRMDVYSYLSKQQPNLGEFRVLVSSPLPTWKILSQRRLSDAHLHHMLKPKTEFDEIFCLICQYISWHSYELLKKIVDRYGDPSIKKQMEDYCTELDRFENHTSIDKIRSIALSTPQVDSTTLEVQLPDHDCSQFLASEVRTLQHSIAKEAGIEREGIRTHMIVQSSVKIIFLVPRSLAPYLIASSVCPLLASPGPLPDDVYERCVQVVRTEEAFRLMGRPLTSEISIKSTQPLPLPFNRSTSSFESVDSYEPRSKLPAKDNFADPNHVKIFDHKVLDNGAFAVVCMAQFDHLSCAAKFVHPTLAESSSWQLQRFREGCKFLESTHHPNIVSFLGLHQEERLPAPVLLMELMDGSLMSHLENATFALPMHAQQDICLDVAQGVAYIHSRQYIHGDLNATNVLLRSGRAKIGGMMTLQQKLPDTKLAICPGSPQSLPLESLTSSRYDESIDCFAFGTLAIHVATRKVPAPTPYELLSLQKRPLSEAERYSSSMKNIVPNHPLLSIITRCICDEASQRPSATELCQELSNLRESAKYQSSLSSELLANELVGRQIKHMQDELFEREEENQALRAKLVEASKENWREAAIFQNTMKEYKSKIETKEREKMELQHQISQGKEDLQKLEDAMKTRITIVSCENTDLKEKLDAANNQLSKKQNEHKYELEKGKKEKEQIIEKFQKERQKSGDMYDKIQELEKEKTHFKERLEESDRKCAEMVQEKLHAQQ